MYFLKINCKLFTDSCRLYKYKNQSDTIEIRSQGGINAANGFYDFRVYPVQVVPQAPKMRREENNSRRRGSNSSKPVTFAAVLDTALEESQPIDCYTVTYNASSQLQTFYYMPSKEYTL